MKFVVGENGRNPKKHLPRPRFIHHETHMEEPRRELGTPAVEGERLTACATRPPSFVVIPYKFNALVTFLMFRFFMCDNSESSRLALSQRLLFKNLIKSH